VVHERRPFAKTEPEFILGRNEAGSRFISLAEDEQLIYLRWWNRCLESRKIFWECSPEDLRNLSQSLHTSLRKLSRTLANLLAKHLAVKNASGLVKLKGIDELHAGVNFCDGDNSAPELGSGASPYNPKNPEEPQNPEIRRVIKTLNPETQELSEKEKITLGVNPAATGEAPGVSVENPAGVRDESGKGFEFFEKNSGSRVQGFEPQNSKSEIFETSGEPKNPNFRKNENNRPLGDSDGGEATNPLPATKESNSEPASGQKQPDVGDIQAGDGFTPDEIYQAFRNILGPTSLVSAGLLVTKARHCGVTPSRFVQLLLDKVQYWIEQKLDDPVAATVRGFGNQGGNQNRHRERLWYSPHCVAQKKEAVNMTLFEELA
jgi:hypothetical protein